MTLTIAEKRPGRKIAEISTTESIDILPRPVYLRHPEAYQSGIAQFPLLNRVGLPYGLKHGFSWGGLTNYSFVKGRTTPYPETLVRIRDFFKEIGASDTGTHLGIDGVQGIIQEGYFVADSFFRNQLAKNPNILKEIDEIYGAVSEGAVTLSVHAIFTDVPDLPITFKPGDCVGMMLFARNRRGKPITGIMHSGRKEIGEGFANTALQAVKEVYGANPDDIYLGVGPSISPRHHTVDSAFAAKLLQSNFQWKNHLKESRSEPDQIEVDMRGLLYEQLAEEIPLQNIQSLEECTYEAATSGTGFSRRYTTSQGMTLDTVPNGRPIMVVSL